MQKRFVSWAAVSSLPQAKEISLSEQKEVNQRHIDRHGGALVATLEVPGESRDIDLFEEARDRIEAYAQLNDLINAKAFDVLICLTRSRLGRTLALIEAVAQKCRRVGIIIYETESPPSSLEIGESSDTDLLTGAVRSWSAQREVDELRRRHKMGMLGKLKKGDFLSGVPWGWKAEYDSQGRATIVVDPDAARTIRFALVDLYLGQGMGSRQISAELNRRGWLTATGRPWAHELFGAMFRMLWRYAGWGEINRVSKERPYARSKGNWPSILTDEELYQILEERASRTGARGRNANVYRLSLIVHCAICQKRMRMQKTPHKVRLRNGNINVHTYVNALCTGQRHANRSVPVTRIIKEIRSLFIRLQDEGNWAPYLEPSDSDTTSIDVETLSLEREIRKAEQAILESDDKLIDGTFDEARHAHQVKRLKARILGLQGDITQLADRRQVIERAGQRIARLQEIAEHGLSYLEMEDERLANTHLRRLITVEVAGGQVAKIVLL